MIDWNATDPDMTVNLAAILGIWILVMAVGMRDCKEDDAGLKSAKRMLRYTFTATLAVCVLLAGWALYMVKTK